MDVKEILSRLPYSNPFLFVDEVTQVDENGLFGHYTFPPESFFYKGHFKNNPVTPGVILTECMAQIGLVCLGIFLLNKENSNAKNAKIALSSSEIEFYKPVFPGETVKVVSKKQYFRFNKLKCVVEMYNTKNELVCKGTIAGMMKLSSE
ncbi:3-hydroxyacyl-ACP dehydratase FabZ family protein [Zunongwangia sp. F260]|uniref:3-hydroxyacyl-ACP dehydratase FabZ family protein n=1 Tax=Autumnicola lenta TaxID=3075593 RepID=A0ABU3CN23_9FLAO|nr:3-hydroxyacyl-ACP dehydratase FabZ family protein [Zunongwangia sp. F260]MDT0647637.1 3-hydroxyacyl-ACP dehydratase FabZ family protein [Zunongwangia sp. F260]